jgi:delta 1-pyrroline-5-carboxylate dehydrogenase
VVKWRPPVECAYIKTLSTAVTLLRNAVDFFRNVAKIIGTIARDDAEAAREIVLNVIDWLEEDQ